MWQRSYIECCAELGQWKTLEDLGKSVDDYNLLANVYSKSLMWRELKETILPFALVSFSLSSMEEAAKSYLLERQWSNFVSSASSGRSHHILTIHDF